MHKKTLFSILFMLSVAQSMIPGGNEKFTGTNDGGWYSGKKAVDNFNKGTAENIDKLNGVIDGNIHTASDELSKALIATAVAIGKMAETKVIAYAVAAKGVAIAAAPYVAGGAAVVAVGYGGYKLYQSGQPSEEKFKTQLQNCLYDNKNGPFNKHRIPENCTEEYKNFAIWAGDAKAQDKVEAFKKCS